MILTIISAFAAGAIIIAWACLTRVNEAEDEEERYWREFYKRHRSD